MKLTFALILGLAAASLGLAAASFDSFETELRRIRRDAKQHVHDLKHSAASARVTGRVARGGAKQLVSTAHPDLHAAFAENGRITPSDILAALAAAESSGVKALAAPRARPVISRLGGIAETMDCETYKHTGGWSSGGACYEEEVCSGRCPEGSFYGCEEFFTQGLTGAFCPTGSSKCMSCKDVQTCSNGGKYLTDCGACCIDEWKSWSPQGRVGSCKSCGYGDPDSVGAWSDCIECEPHYEIVPLWDDCTGMCMPKAIVAQYEAIGFGTLSTSSCVAQATCYEDQDFIRALPQDGKNDCLPLEGDDDEITNDCYAIWADCIDEDGQDVPAVDDWWGDDGDDDIYATDPCEDDFDDELPRLDETATCSDMQASPRTARLCKKPYKADICEDEWHAMSECLAEDFVARRASGEECDISCADALAATPVGDTPTKAPAAESDSAAGVLVSFKLLAAAVVAFAAL